MWDCEQRSSQNESLPIFWKELGLSKLNPNLEPVLMPFTMVPPEALSTPRKISWQLKTNKQTK